jgi:hypothetical protein
MSSETPNTRAVNSVGAEVRSEINPRLQKTFDYAIEVTKQLLTLGSAVLALTITIGKDAGTGKQGLLFAGWLSFLISIICGIVGLYALMAEFAPRQDGRAGPPSIGSWRVRGPLLLQIVTFALGAVLLVAYAYSVYKPGSLG